MMPSSLTIAGASNTAPAKRPFEHDAFDRSIRTALMMSALPKEMLALDATGRRTKSPPPPFPSLPPAHPSKGISIDASAKPQHLDTVAKTLQERMFHSALQVGGGVECESLSLKRLLFNPVGGGSATEPSKRQRLHKSMSEVSYFAKLPRSKIELRVEPEARQIPPRPLLQAGNNASSIPALLGEAHKISKDNNPSPPAPPQLLSSLLDSRTNGNERARKEGHRE